MTWIDVILNTVSLLFVYVLGYYTGKEISDKEWNKAIQIIEDRIKERNK